MTIYASACSTRSGWLKHTAASTSLRNWRSLTPTVRRPLDARGTGWTSRLECARDPRIPSVESASRATTGSMSQRSVGRWSCRNAPSSMPDSSAAALRGSIVLAWSSRLRSMMSKFRGIPLASHGGSHDIAARAASRPMVAFGSLPVFTGSLQAEISSRLPAWGRGVLKRPPITSHSV